MAYALTLVFDGVTEEQYWAVNDKLGISRDGAGDWPAGMIIHAGGPTGDNGWLVSEIWDSRSSHESFMATRLGPALGAVGVPEPVQVFDADTVNVHQP